MSKTIDCNCAGIGEHADDCVAECLYCGVEIPTNDAEIVPKRDDTDEWDRLALLHGDGCEWIETRAHRCTSRSDLGCTE